MTAVSRAATRILFAVLWLAVAPLAAQEARPEPGIQVNVMMPLRDGVKLATDVYLPEAARRTPPGKVSTILIRTPYNKGAGKSAEGRFFSKNGYAVVIQDTRGRYSSEGIWHWLTDDGPDGADCCEWIANQPWSNGRIGMMGTSYVGGTQHAVAMEGSPHLKTVIHSPRIAGAKPASIRSTTMRPARHTSCCRWCPPQDRSESRVRDCLRRQVAIALPSRLRLHRLEPFIKNRHQLLPVILPSLG